MSAAIDEARARDGLRLLTRHWAARGPAEPWAAVLLVHGLGEHSGRYEHVGERLATAGVDVQAFDLRGFGGSAGKRAYVDRWAQFLDDVQDRLTALRAAVPGVPAVLYGHSMGGLIVFDYAMSGRPPPDCLVLSAPGLDSTIPRWKQGLAGLLVRVAPELAIPNDLPSDGLARDPAVWRAYADDPLVEMRSTARLGAEGFAAQRRARSRLVGLRMPVPTLVLHGEADPIVPVAVSAPLEGVPDVTRRVYPGARHEVHNDLGWEHVVDGVVSWLRGRV